MNAQAFEEELLRFIGESCGMAGQIRPETPLIESGLIDSRAIVDLMEFIERSLDITITDEKLSMEYFRTPAHITRAFAGGEEVR